MANPGERWPQGYSAAISVTMDNMGEAAELFRGTWPQDEPIGEHVSVTDSLPRMLELFERYDITATYFIEAWNAGVYPETIRQVRDRGHEIALHGWQHEPWAELDHESEARLLSRSRDAFEGIGINVRGFRPPGGRLTTSSIELLAAHGFTYCSPAGVDPAVVDRLAVLPFDWGAIDAYYYSESFAPLRNLRGDPGEPLTPERLTASFTSILTERVQSGGYIAVLFHPFLELEAARFEAMRDVVEWLAAQNHVWCAPCGEIADWIRAYPERFPSDPKLDNTSWTAGAR